jgi:hypothetical protein
MDINLISNIGMLLLVIGTLPSIIVLLRNRNNLKGFSTIGSVGIASGQAVYLFYFLLLGDYVTSALCVPLVVFWLAVILFKLREKH